MDRRDRIWLWVLTVCWLVFSVGLAIVAYNLFTKSEEKSQSIVAVVSSLKHQIQEQKEQLQEVTGQLDSLQQHKPIDGKDGKDGSDGANGVDGVTRTETVTTSIEKPITITPEVIHGINGKTPLFALDGETHRLMVRYGTDEEWSVIPVVCQEEISACEEAQ